MTVCPRRQGRLTIPVALAPAAPGDAFEARFDEEEDAIVFRRIKRGLLDADVTVFNPFRESSG